MKLTTKQKIASGAIAVITTIVGAVVALGNDYYVDSVNGSDTTNGGGANNCAIISPCKTITKGMSQLVAGDTLHLTGTFSSVTVSKKGTADKPITIDGGKMVCLIISGDYINVSDVEVTGCGSHGVFISGDYVNFTNSKVHDTVRDNGVAGKCTGAGQWGSGVKVQEGSHVNITGNEIWNNCGEGIGFRGSYIVAEENFVHNNYSVEIYIDNSPFSTAEDNTVYCVPGSNPSDNNPTGIALGEEVYSGWGAQRHDDKVINNRVSGCLDGIVSWTSYINGQTLRNVVISGNTVSNVGRYAMKLWGLNENVLIENNVTSNKIQVTSSLGVTMVNNTLIGTTPTITPTKTQPGPSPVLTTRTPTRTATPIPPTYTRIPTGTLLYGDFTVTPSRTPSPTVAKTVTPSSTPICWIVAPNGRICYYYPYPNP